MRITQGKVMSAGPKTKETCRTRISQRALNELQDCVRHEAKLIRCTERTSIPFPFKLNGI